MPAKNVLKTYIEEGHYHIYNRGVEKRIIFQDDQDYKVFLSYLKTYLEPPGGPTERVAKIGETTFIAPKRPLNNFHQEITLLAYCLMPNHFHLQVKQKSPRSIELFMRSLLTRYSTYFNKRYKRVGSLFQGTYKGVLVEGEAYLLHLSRYIHLNPVGHRRGDVKDAPLHKWYSSYKDYLKLRKTQWLEPELILSFFKSAQKTHFKDILSYQSFVEDYLEDSRELLGNLTLEEDDT